MKLAVSNIAWARHDDPEVLNLLRENGVTGIELAPTKIWEDWQGADYSAAAEYKDFLDGEGFAVPAMQAILFGRPELQVFDRDSWDGFIEHFKLLAELAHGLGAGTLVFGAPKNRKRNSLAYFAAADMAVELFDRLARTVAGSGAVIGIEANPVEYACDFMTALADVHDIVRRTDSPQVQVHVDSAAIHMCRGNFRQEITALESFCHYHISEPLLAPIAGGEVAQDEGYAVLRDTGYQGWVSVEMKQPERSEDLAASLACVAAGLGIK